MGSANGSRPPSKSMRKEIVVSSLSPSKPNVESSPNPNPKPDLSAALVLSSGVSAGSAAMFIEGKEEDDALAGSQFLSREEVLRRRSRRLKQLNRCYRRQYWALMEEIRVKHRDYYWEFGKSPLEEDNASAAQGMLVENAGLGHVEEENGSSSRGERKRCSYIGCKSKAMPLTIYCHAHILFDTKQTLYKACNYILKSIQQRRNIYDGGMRAARARLCEGYAPESSTIVGPQICAKPVLRAAVPSLCPVHFQRSQRQLSQALKKAGVNAYSQNKPVPKLSVMISECVRQIQAKRQRSRKAHQIMFTDKDENVNRCP